MVSCKTKVKDHKLIVRVRTLFGENVDEKVLDTFSRAYLRGFLKPKLIKKNVVDYVGPVGTTLHDRFKEPISKRDFYSILEQTVLAIQKLHNSGMYLNSLVLDLKNVYMNPVTKEVQFLYIPLEASKTIVDIPEFIEAIVYSVKPTAEDDMDYVSDFVMFWKTQKNFDITAVETYIATKDRELVVSLKKQNAGQSGFITDKQREYIEHQNQKAQCTEEDTGKLEDYEATGLLNEEEPTGLLNERTTEIDYCEATGLLFPEDTCKLLDDFDDGTTLLSDNTVAVSTAHYPTLYRVSTKETISVNKPVFRLGKERSYVDYFVANNNAVSRSHADIITRTDKYFVTDLNSTNCTFINNQPLAANTEVEINDGDKLKLGNEEFEFHI